MKNRIFRLALLLALLVGLRAQAADGLRFQPLNIEPGQRKTATSLLDNAVSYSAF